MFTEVCEPAPLPQTVMSDANAAGAKALSITAPVTIAVDSLVLSCVIYFTPFLESIWI